MTYKTKGIVLKTVKYGETSLVVTIFTENFGVQTYIVNGIRVSSKKGAKAAMYQPSAILQMEVYHNQNKNINRIKEAEWAFIYENVLSNILKNAIALYMVELMYKTLKQPEQHKELFYFCEDVFMNLDGSGESSMANYPLFFALHLPYFFGFKISEAPKNIDNQENILLDLQEGVFTNTTPTHNFYLAGSDVVDVANLLLVRHPEELGEIKLTRAKRKLLLEKFSDYYNLHIQDFGKIKTLPVLQAIFD